jgi:hypothetical protein
MAIDRAGARRRVRTITAWTAGGAAVLTAALAFGASRGNTVAKAHTTRPNNNSTTPQDPGPASTPAPDQGYYTPEPGFTPPSTSSGPPAGMSGGS